MFQEYLGPFPGERFKTSSLNFVEFCIDPLHEAFFQFDIVVLSFCNRILKLSEQDDHGLVMNFRVT